MVRYGQDVQFIADKLRQGTSADEPVWFAAAGKSADLAFLAKGLSHMRRILTKKYQGYRMDAFSAS